MLKVRGLTKRYGETTVVSDLSFEIGAGEVVGFLGPNGAGKSTTLRMITGFLSPTAGSVTIAGVDVSEDPIAARASFGYMPEGVPLYPELRVSEYLKHRAELKGVFTRGAAEAALERAGVLDAQSRIIGQLSKGYRQRVGIADALLGDPQLLILDEPTSGLDPNQIRHVRELIRSFAGEKTVFLSTHILPEVEATCDRVLILNKGRLVREGTTDTLRRVDAATMIVLSGRGALAEFEVALSPLAAGAISGSESNGVATLRFALETDATSESVFQAVVGAGLSIKELREEEAKLEEVFASLTLMDADSPEAPGEEE